jgi:hypothetical protein
MEVGSAAEMGTLIVIGITVVGERVSATQKIAENSRGGIVLENFDACDDTLDEDSCVKVLASIPSRSAC